MTMVFLDGICATGGGPENKSSADSDSLIGGGLGPGMKVVTVMGCAAGSEGREFPLRGGLTTPYRAPPLTGAVGIGKGEGAPA